MNFKGRILLRSHALFFALVTVLNSEPEIQYVARCNINLIVQKRSHILQNEIKVFFREYNDPIYVKMEGKIGNYH